MKYIISAIATLLLLPHTHAATNNNRFWSPSDIKALTFRLIDNFVDNADFSLQYTLQKPATDIQTVDFKSSCPNLNGVAYALSTIECETDLRQSFQVGGTGDIKIWIDKELVFQRTKEPFTPLLDERSYLLSDSFSVALTQGKHTILVKSSNCDDKRWIFIMQGEDNASKKVSFSIRDYIPSLANEASWLVAGTFAGDINTVCEPEREIKLFNVYRSHGRSIAWNTPRVNLMAQNTDKNMEWSDHLGGFMWAMQRLSDETGEGKYERFAQSWCSQMLGREPLVKHQVFELNGFSTMNYGQAGTPMLSLVCAPNIPYAVRLARAEAFPESALYRKKADEVIDYLQNFQYRNSGVFARTHTKYPSVCVDDMFMGLPFMLQYAKTAKRQSQRDSLLSDAVSQLFRFVELLRDPATGLYHQSCYPSDHEKSAPFQGQGNGHALWATSEVLDAMTYKDKDYNRVRNLYRSHVDALLKYQHTDGYWRDTLNMPATNGQASCTAMVTMCMARGINRGWISRTKYAPFMVNGWNATASFLNDKADIANDTRVLLPFTFAAIEMMKFAYGCQNCY